MGLSGRTSPIVWDCAEDEWPDLSEAAPEEGVPWPAEDIDAGIAH
jgi:hypothetical protein